MIYCTLNKHNSVHTNPLEMIYCTLNKHNSVHTNTLEMIGARPFQVYSSQE